MGEPLYIDIDLPRPHPRQEEFLTSPAKRKVIVAGRRGGKTTGVSIMAVRRMMDGRRVLEAAPTQDQTEQFWDKCKVALAPAISAGIVYKNETKRLLCFIDPNRHGRIRCKTAWDADSLRGDYADELILDEFSLMDPGAWDEVGAPMLLDNDGNATFIFTPQRRNHAYAMYVKAKADLTGRYGAWHFTSFDNPHLSQAALDEITADMTEEAYQQEILAQFLENEGAVFHHIDRCLYPGGEGPADHLGHTLVMAVDWGKKQDYTALSVGCLECGREVALTRFNQIGYDIQRGRLAEEARRWGVVYILAEANAMGEANIDQLIAEGWPVAGWTMTAVSKPPLISNLALVVERGDVKYLADPVATAELESFEVKYSPTTGRPSYAAPAGCHDDTVIARALLARILVDRESILL